MLEVVERVKRNLQVQAWSENKKWRHGKLFEKRAAATEKARASTPSTPDAMS